MVYDLYFIEWSKIVYFPQMNYIFLFTPLKICPSHGKNLNFLFIIYNFEA